MSKDGIGLAELNAFAAIAMHRSFRKAADELGVKSSTLSHLLRAMEERLGVRLLNRTTRSVAPTEAGERLLGRLRPVLRELDDALGELEEVRRRPRGTLRINASEIAARALLSEFVPTFLARHPEMKLDLVTDGDLVDIVAQGFDAGIRLAEAIPQDMIAVPLGEPTRFIAIASPAYLRERKKPRVPAELRDHSCIRYRMTSGKMYRWEFSKRGETVTVDVPGALTLDHPDLMVRAAADGLGIAYVPDSAARDAIDAGRLGIVLGDWSPPVPGVALYYPGHRHVPAGLRALIDVVRSVRAAATAG